MRSAGRGQRPPGQAQSLRATLGPQGPFPNRLAQAPVVRGAACGWRVWLAGLKPGCHPQGQLRPARRTQPVNHSQPRGGRRVRGQGQPGFHETPISKQNPESVRETHRPARSPQIAAEAPASPCLPQSPAASEAALPRAHPLRTPQGSLGVGGISWASTARDRRKPARGARPRLEAQCLGVGSRTASPT